jgi:hypothetical protein
MIAVAPSDHRNAVCSNRWPSTGKGGARSMMGDNGRDGGSVVPFQSRSGGSAARIGILGITWRSAAWSASTTVITAPALKSP